jgi:serine/threonine protein kinase
MSTPGVTGPPERLASPRAMGPFTIAARIGAGRRTTSYIGRREGEERFLVLRELHKNIDPDVFQAEMMNAHGLVVGAPPDPLARVGMTAFATGPLLVGENLATILEGVFTEGRPIHHEVALTIAMGIADRLDQLADIHGDLAPHHVIVGYDGSIHLIDPAKDAYQERARADGRAGYRSPEHVRLDPLLPQSDVFVLGVLLFEMTTARRLFAGATVHENDAKIVEGQLPRPRDIVGDGYPIELQLVLRKLLRPQPTGRFADGRAAKDALRLAASAREKDAPSLARWLEERYPDRRSIWRDLVGDTGEPELLTKRRPVRAPPPAHRSFSLSDPGLEGVRKQIEALDAEARAMIASRSVSERSRLAQEIAHQRRGAPPRDSTIPDARTDVDRVATIEEPRSKLTGRATAETVPDHHSSADDLGSIDLLTDPSPRRRRGRVPLEIVPDIPTEIGKARRIEPGPAADLPRPPPRSDTLPEPPPLLLEPSDSDARTSLDDLAMIEKSLESIDLGVPPPLLDGFVSTADASTEGLELPDEPASHRLSSDLTLPPERPAGNGAGPSSGLRLEELTEDLLDPEPDLSGDTIQDQDAEAVLGDAVIAQVAEVLGASRDDGLPRVTEETFAQARAPRDPPAAERIPTQPRPGPVTDPGAALEEEPLTLPKRRVDQARVDTQIVRQRDIRPPTPVFDDPILPAPIEPEPEREPEPEPEPNSRAERAASRRRAEPGGPALPDRDPMNSIPRREPPEVFEPDDPPAAPPRSDTNRPIAVKVASPIRGHEESSVSNLVIPISDDEIFRGRRRRLAIAAGIVGVVGIVAFGGFLMIDGFEGSLSTPGTRASPPAVAAVADASEAGDASQALEVALTPDASIAPEVVAEPPPEPVVEPPPAKRRPPPPRAPSPDPDRFEPSPDDPPAEAASTQVRVRALPDEAVITVDGRFEIENGGLVEIRGEPIRVVATATGWEEKAVTVEPGRKEDLLILLKKKTP